MTLEELLARHGRRAQLSVPDWMLGFWKRYSISFADGLTDLHTHVCWLQSRNFTIDLRLPLEMDQARARALEDCSPEELNILADYEGWMADAEWDGTALMWSDPTASLQLHNRWPEPALLKRTGNCMIEHCPSNAYVEDWRLQPSNTGPLVGLRLIDERDVDSGAVRHRGGGLIVCGDYAALTLGRAEQGVSERPLKALVAEAGGDIARLRQLFNFETSVAKLDAERNYRIFLSTQPGRMGDELFPRDGFSVQGGRVVQNFKRDGATIGRRFEIDTLEAEAAFLQHTAAPDAETWRAREAATLMRYTEVLR